MTGRYASRLGCYDNASMGRAPVLGEFDPEGIAADGAASVHRRELIREAMTRNGTRWDYSPEWDATTMYVR